MPIFKVICQERAHCTQNSAGKYKDDDALHDVLSYCGRYGKASCVDGIGVYPPNAIYEMQRLARAYGQDRGVRLRHWILSFSKDELRQFNKDNLLTINETNIIMLDGPKFAGSDYGVTFFFDGSSSIDVLKELQEGDTVTIRGYLDGSDYKDLVRFDFYKCTVSRTPVQESTQAPSQAPAQSSLPAPVQSASPAPIQSDATDPAQSPAQAPAESERGYSSRIMVTHDMGQKGYANFISCSIYVDDIGIGSIFAGGTEFFDIYLGSGKHTIRVEPSQTWDLEEFNTEVDFSVERDHQIFSFTIKDDSKKFTLDETTAQ